MRLGRSAAVVDFKGKVDAVAVELPEDLVLRRTLVLPANCELRPVTDDMALCHPSLARNDGRLALMDAENGWFVRVNHITDYGTDPNLERMTIHPVEPLLFLNIEAQPGSDMPSASAMLFIESAVPMVLQVPEERLIEASASRNSSCVISPAFTISENFHRCVPEPTRSPRK